MLRPTADVQLSEEVEKIIELFSPHAEDRDIQLTCNGSGLVIGDRVMIQRAISNLLTNAIRNSPASTVVVITVAELKESVKIEVTN